MLLIIIGAEGIAGWGSWGPGRQDLLGHDTKSSGHEANGWSFGVVGNLRRCLEVAIDRLLWLLGLCCSCSSSSRAIAVLLICINDNESHKTCVVVVVARLSCRSLLVSTFLFGSFFIKKYCWLAAAFSSSCNMLYVLVHCIN